MSSTNLKFPTKVKNHMFNSVIDYAGTNQPLRVILLRELTFDEINTLPSYDWYGSIGTPLPNNSGYRNNIKTLEVPGGGNYVPNSKVIPGTPTIYSDDIVTVYGTDSASMSVNFASLNCTVFGYAIVGTVSVNDIYPVIAYEYFNSSVVLKDSDFQLSWVQGKVNDVIRNYLYKWVE